jgi:methyl-accepting chemotaxis protein
LKRVAEQFTHAGESSSNQNITGTMQRLSEQLRAFGEEVMDRTNQQARDIEQARVWTNDIVKLGQAIAAIASNARILTFNARLESARIGEAGRGFAVIAASIQDLATQVRQTNQSVSDLAANLLRALPALGNDALQTSNAAREAVAKLESQLLDLQSHLADARTASWEALSESSDTARVLRDKANTVIGHLQFQDRASQMMQEVEAQATTVLKLAGLSEREVGKEVIEQVGAIGRGLEGGEAARPMGHVELF